MKTDKDERSYIQIDINELDQFIERVQKRKLLDEDYDIITVMTQTLKNLSETLRNKNATINKLRQMLFGHKTERSKNIFNTSKTDDSQKEKTKKKEPKKGHGRNSVSAYTGAKTYVITHEE